MMGYDIHFAVSGILLCLLIHVFITLHYPKRDTVKAFQRVIIYNIIGAVSDAITGFYDAYPSALPLWVKYVLNSLCLAMGVWTTYAILQYMIIYIKEKDENNTNLSVPKTIVISRIVFSMLFVVNVFVPILFYFDEAGYYIHGSIYLFIFAVPILHVLYVGWFTIEKRRLLQANQIQAIIVFIVFSIMGIFLQVLFFPHILLIYFFASLSILCMAFTLETPNFIKLTETLEELERAKVIAESATKAKDTFLANISHEIRTPLNAILGMNSMIIRETKESKTNRYAQNIKSAGNTLLSIINDLLDISKVESGMMELVCADYRTASVFNDVRNMTMLRAEAKGLEFEVNIAPHFPARLNGDEVRIRQIMLNLVNNAVKYTPAGKVTLNVLWNKIEDGRIRMTIKVSDTGIGIKEEDIENLFVNFKRLNEPAIRNIEGTGLGLPLTKQLAEMMDGDIEVQSEYGKGSVFTVHIMQGYVNDDEIENMNEIYEYASSKAADYEAKLWAPEANILAVDDNEINLEVFTELLNITEMNISTASSGEECIAMCKKNKYDVIFLDQMMPGLDGAMTLEALKEKHYADGTPVIMFTADAIAGAREKYVETGFDDFMTKPVMYERIEEILYRYLPKEKIRSLKEVETKAKKDVSLLVIDDTKDKLDSHKSKLEGYKSRFVLDGKRASKYMANHDVDYVMITKEEYERLCVDNNESLK